MKHLRLPFICICLVSFLQAEPVDPFCGDGFNLPKSNFRELLEITGKLANKPVVVSSDDELRIPTSMVIPGPISPDAARKAISALLLLEGYELVEKGEELHLHKILTKEQCDALNQALGRPRQETPAKLPLTRVAARGSSEEKPKDWIVIRPGLEK